MKWRQLISLGVAGTALNCATPGRANALAVATGQPNDVNEVFEGLRPEDPRGGAGLGPLPVLPRRCLSLQASPLVLTPPGVATATLAPRRRR